MADPSDLPAEPAITPWHKAILWPFYWPLLWILAIHVGTRLMWFLGIK